MRKNGSAIQKMSIIIIAHFNHYVWHLKPNKQFLLYAFAVTAQGLPPFNKTRPSFASRPSHGDDDEVDLQSAEKQITQTFIGLKLNSRAFHSNLLTEQARFLAGKLDRQQIDYLFIYWRRIALSTAQGFPLVWTLHKYSKKKTQPIQICN